jgi:proteic killer suppression protein
VIKSFACKETESLFYRAKSRRLPQQILATARRKLLWLDSAMDLEDLKTPPGNRLEALKGDRRGQYSIRINEQYRICFVWKGSHAYDVEIIDYH